MNLRCRPGGRRRPLREYGSAEQFAFVPTLYARAMNEFEAYVYISAPFDLREPEAAAELKVARRRAMQPLHNTYFARTADRRLKRTMCIFPYRGTGAGGGHEPGGVYRLCVPGL